jgi:hypothetical protein
MAKWERMTILVFFRLKKSEMAKMVLRDVYSLDIVLAKMHGASQNSCRSITQVTSILLSRSLNKE